jgi:hypothetical protein
MLEVVFRRPAGVLCGVRLMSLRQMRVVRGLMMIACVLVLRGFGMMMRRQAVMVRRLAMFVRCLFRHLLLLRARIWLVAASPFFMIGEAPASSVTAGSKASQNAANLSTVQVIGCGGDPMHCAA